MALHEPLRVDAMRARLQARYDEFHLGAKPFGLPGEKASQAVLRWRRGYCGAALQNAGLMAPWMAASDAVQTGRHGVSGSAVPMRFLR